MSKFDLQQLCKNTSIYPELRQELRECRGCYILDEVKMPASCGGVTCTIEFRYYGEDLIQLHCLEAPIAYSGGNPKIAQWLEEGTIAFGSFDQLAAFLKQIGKEGERSGNAPLNRPSRQRPTLAKNADSVQIEPALSVSAPNPERGIAQYDRDNLTVPDTHKSYIEIDKNRLVLDLTSEIFGQEEQIKKIVHLVGNHLGTKNRTRPISIFLYGSTGVGKSKVIEYLVEYVNRQTEKKDHLFYQTIDCNKFAEKADISKLIGSAPGYVGYDDPGTFAVLEDHPNTVFVFEEIEKAAPNVTTAIMQAMETGRQETNGKTLSNGETYYDLSHSIIFFTSNIVLEEKKRMGFGTSESPRPQPNEEPRETNIAKAISKETAEAKLKMLDTGKFRREIIGRMMAIIKFNDLSGDVVKDICAKSICRVADDHRLCVTKIETPVLQEFINETAEKAENFGVRDVRGDAHTFFNEAFLNYSHEHEDYANIIVSGTLDNVEVLPS